jgi:DNA (cytosine-5)-methyltransferase 1
MTQIRIGSLCSGIGGLEMGLERALSGETLWQVEIEVGCRAVLAAHWPNAERFDDVCTVGAQNLRPVDLICFGSPCQDLSSAGKRTGLNGPKSRLFYECARVVGELGPEWVVIENVASGATRWVDAVRSEMGRLGYATLPVPIAASDLGAPHRRSRVFIVANLNGDSVLKQSGGGERKDWSGSLLVERNGETRTAADANRTSDCWRTPVPDILRVVHGVSGRTHRANDRARIAALGNSCTPAQAETVGHVIRQLMEAAKQC